MKLIIVLLLTGAAFAQNVSVAVGTLSVPNEAAAIYERWRLTQFAALATPLTLNGAITASTTAITVTGNTAQLTVGQQLVIESEMMPLTAVAGQTLTVTRAAYIVGGVTLSVPASHNTALSVNACLWSSAVLGFRQLIADQVRTVISSYCQNNASQCPTLSAQYTAQQNAATAIATFLAGVVQ